MARILVLDDEDQIRRMLRRILEKEGHVVFEAEDGGEGVAVCENDPVDLVITDILMPNKDGLETILALRSNKPGVKIIAMSGGGQGMPSEGCLILASDLGADAVLQKPMSKSDLLATIAQLLPHADGLSNK